ncbi:trehalase-like domain-containing protein [Streptomyces sp. NBC_01620]
MVWLCAPRWHSGAVFSSLIGGPSHYTISPRAGSCGAASTRTAH